MWIPNLFLTFEHTAGESICPAHYNRLTILYREFRRASDRWCLGNLPATLCERHYVLLPNKTPIRELLQGHIWKPEVLFRATHAFSLRVESTHLFMGLGLFPNLIKNVFYFFNNLSNLGYFRFNIKVIQIVPIYLFPLLWTFMHLSQARANTGTLLWVKLYFVWISLDFI